MSKGHIRFQQICPFLLTFEKVYVVRSQNHLYEGFDGLLIFFRKDQYAVNQFCIRNVIFKNNKNIEK